MSRLFLRGTRDEPLRVYNSAVVGRITDSGDEADFDRYYLKTAQRKVTREALNRDGVDWRISDGNHLRWIVKQRQRAFDIKRTGVLSMLLTAQRCGCVETPAVEKKEKTKAKTNYVRVGWRSR